MASKAKYAIISAFLRLVNHKDFEKITVTDLVEECDISRQTFYYHFDDIEKMLAWAFETETGAICRSEGNDSLKLATLKYVDFFKRYDTMLVKAIHSPKCLLVFNLLYSSFYQFIAYCDQRQPRKDTAKYKDKEIVISGIAASLCGLLMLTLQEERDYNALAKNIITYLRAIQK